LKRLSIRSGHRGLRSVFCLVFLLLAQLANSLPSATAAGPVWKYTALGDSLATGAYAPAGKGYVWLYKGYLGTDAGASVTLKNDGRNGWTSDSLVWAVSAPDDPMKWQADILGSSVVTVNIGGNNFRKARDQYRAKQGGGADNQDGLRQAVAAFKSDFSGILWSILQLRSKSSTIIRTMDLYNPFVAIDQKTTTWPSNPGTDFDVFQRYYNEVNQSIADAALYYGIPCAKVSVAFNGLDGRSDPVKNGLVNNGSAAVLGDTFHPTVAGHQKIADLLRKLGYAPLK
jgi:lysophospholipase L1-like esterase